MRYPVSFTANQAWSARYSALPLNMHLTERSGLGANVSCRKPCATNSEACCKDAESGILAQVLRLRVQPQRAFRLFLWGCEVSSQLSCVSAVGVGFPLWLRFDCYQQHIRGWRPTQELK